MVYGNFRPKRVKLQEARGEVTKIFDIDMTKKYSSIKLFTANVVLKRIR